MARTSPESTSAKGGAPTLRERSDSVGSAAADKVRDRAAAAGERAPTLAQRSALHAPLLADLSEVRVHTSKGAHELAGSLNAHAYTTGAHVAARGGGAGGRNLVAHELSHVVQQGRR